MNIKKCRILYEISYTLNIYILYLIYSCIFFFVILINYIYQIHRSPQAEEAYNSYVVDLEAIQAQVTLVPASHTRTC